MDTHHYRQRLWKLLTNPAIEVIATILLGMAATWYLVEGGSADHFPLFGRR
jgi:hypothetical protein